MYIRTIETGDELACGAKTQTLDDFAPGRCVCRSGQSDARDLRETFVQNRQLPIFRTEIVSPLRDAMRLVDREQRYRHATELLQAALGQQALRRHIQQLQGAIGETTFDIALGGGVETGIQICRFDAVLVQRIDLILHQCDQRRDHNRGAFAQQRRNLVAQRFAAAGRHQHQRVAAIDDVLDYGLLFAAKRGIAKNVAKQVERGRSHCADVSKCNQRIVAPAGAFAARGFWLR